MKPESAMRRRVIVMLHGTDPISVENPVHPGTPDVNCTLGWVELKWLPAWPLRSNTPVRIKHFTNQQRVWLLRRWNADRRAWLLLQIETSWLLFDGKAAAYHVGLETRNAIEAAALRVWTGTPDGADLQRVLRDSGQPSTLVG